MGQEWWKESVVYQIYPRSFKDSNGDGIGDIKGIISELDYLKELGVDVVWLSPVYQSPNDDNGYDISDYRKIMDEFGTMEDWELLLQEMHQRGIKLIMDLVVNHSSDEHEWFVKSRQSIDNPYRDYYYWREGKDGKEPNNWGSVFSGSAWQLDETTGEYYLHLFSKKQPDLNWENPKLREEIYDMMTWWLEKGIDGFRMDVINMISKAPGLPSASPKNDHPYQDGGEFYVNGPRIHEFLHEMKDKVLSKYDILTVGETPGVTPEDAIEFTHEERGSLSMIFQFSHVDVDSGPGGKWDVVPWKLTDIKKIMSKWQYALEDHGWNSLYLNNHDQPRSVSRFGDDTTYRIESAKMLATFLHMMKGTPYVYQGEELGMTNVQFESIDDYKDIEIQNMYREATQAKDANLANIMASIYSKGRDNARTPMQWSDEENAGFTSGTPWIKVNPNYKEINAKAELNNPDSIFYYYKTLIQLRKQHPVMVHGKYDLILEDNELIYAFTRTYNKKKWLVILNFSKETPIFVLPADIQFEKQSLIISNYDDINPNESIKEFKLRPYEARVYDLEN